MSNQYKSDLDTAKDLEKLSKIVTEAIQKATDIWERTQKTDAFKDLIKQMEQANERLQSEKKCLQDIQKSAVEALENAENLNSELQNLKDLPNMINQLGINSDLLSEIQLILTEVRQLENSSKHNIEAFKSLLNESRNMRALIQETSQEVIAIRDLENYIISFRRPRNYRELWKFLWNELGFLGVLIYLLRLIIPKNRRGNRS